MQTFTRSKTMACFAASMLALSAVPCHAAPYPSEPIHIISPYSSGGPTESVGRALAEAMHTSLGQTPIVESHAGGGGTIGTGMVAEAAPDGYTVLLSHIGFSTAPALYKDPGYDPYKSFEPIGMLVEMPMTLVARTNFPADNIDELISYLKKNQGSVTLAHGGVGAASHLCATVLMDTLGVNLMSLPYRGTGPAMQDVVEKRVDMLCDQTSNAASYITKGRVKSYAVTSMQAVPALPAVPTLDQAGYEGFQVGVWHAMWVPKGTPKPVIAKLTKAVQVALADPKFQANMKSLGANILTDEANGEAVTAKLRQEIPHWAALFRKAGIQPM